MIEKEAMEKEKNCGEGIPMSQKYGHLFDWITSRSRAAPVVNEFTVYEEANLEIRKLIEKVIEENLLPGSRIQGRGNLEDFLSQVKAGKSGLLLAEHYSNMDFPLICYLLEHDGEAGRELSRRIVAISGKKLNEEHPVIRAWTEAYTRIVIYPSRSLSKVDDPAEAARGKKINLAAMRALHEVKKRGQVVALFPSGTRYRPGQEETRRGVREVDSYLRIFDVMAFLKIQGNILRLSPDAPDDMVSDLVTRDRVLISMSPVIECKPFRKETIGSFAGREDIDLKQAVADRVMEQFNVF